MTPLNKIFTSFLFLLLTVTLFSQEIYDYNHSKKFSDYLYKSGQYKLAIDEYERVIFLNPQDTSSMFNLLKSYRLSNKSEAGFVKFDKLFPEENKMPRSFKKEKIRLFIKNDRFNEASHLLSTVPIPKIEIQSFNYGLAIMQKNWEKALLLRDKRIKTDALSAQLDAVLAERLGHRKKSPIIAGMLSAVFPGMGKVYTKRYADAAIALLFVGANAYQSYRGFLNNGEKSAYGWIFGSMAIGFYIGNIYGSAKSARKYNEKYDNEAYEKAKYIFDTSF